jgi:hypothetical protein
MAQGDPSGNIYTAEIPIRKISNALQRHNNENSEQIFQKKYSAAGKYVDRSWEYINSSQTHECENWD